MSIIQVVLGTQIRSKLEALALEFPIMSDVQWLAKVGMINHIHMLLGIFVMVFALNVSIKILKEAKNISKLSKNSSIAMSVLVIVQVVLGLSFVLLGIPELARVFHLWVASLFIGSLLVVYVECKNGRIIENE